MAESELKPTQSDSFAAPAKSSLAPDDGRQRRAKATAKSSRIESSGLTARPSATFPRETGAIRADATRETNDAAPIPRAPQSGGSLTMQIQVNTGSHTQGSAAWSNDIEALVQDKLSHFADRITRVEVHLNDENGVSKEGRNDKRCQVEVRVAGMQPISVTDHAESHDEALHGAANKIVRLLDTTFGKLESR